MVINIYIDTSGGKGQYKNDYWKQQHRTMNHQAGFSQSRWLLGWFTKKIQQSFYIDTLLIEGLKEQGIAAERWAEKIDS